MYTQRAPGRDNDGYVRSDLGHGEASGRGDRYGEVRLPVTILNEHIGIIEDCEKHAEVILRIEITAREERHVSDRTQGSYGSHETMQPRRDVKKGILSQM